jgi:hypothetical protein
LHGKSYGELQLISSSWYLARVSLFLIPLRLAQQISLCPDGGTVVTP